MNWKSAFIWTIIIVVSAGFAGYYYHQDNVEQVSQEAYAQGYKDGWKLAELVKVKLEDSQYNFDLGYDKGYLDALKTRDAYREGYDTGRDEGYAEGYDDAKAGYPYSR